MENTPGSPDPRESSQSMPNNKGRTFLSFLEKAIEAADKPLLILAIVAVVLYLLELRGIVSLTGLARIVSIGLDMLFISDVLLKLMVRRGRYLRSAWLMTDILSCLPGILLLANAPWLQALQFTRLFRVLRVLRGLRVLRSLQFMPSLARVVAEQDEDGRHFRIGMNAAVSAYALAFIGVLSWLRVEFASEPKFLDDAEFFLVIGALLATALFLYLIHSQLRETSWNQLRTLLNIALPRQVAEHFLHHP